MLLLDQVSSTHRGAWLSAYASFELTSMSASKSLAPEKMLIVQLIPYVAGNTFCKTGALGSCTAEAKFWRFSIFTRVPWWSVFPKLQLLGRSNVIGRPVLRF